MLALGFEPMIEKGTCTKIQGTTLDIVNEKMSTCCLFRVGATQVLWRPRLTPSMSRNLMVRLSS